jgi:hypothetical protein
VLSNVAKDVFTEQVTGQAQEWIARQVVDYFDKPEKNREGVYALNRESLPTEFDPARKVTDIPGAAKQKLLVLVHAPFHRRVAPSASCGRSVRRSLKCCSRIRNPPDTEIGFTPSIT